MVHYFPGWYSRKYGLYVLTYRRPGLIISLDDIRGNMVSMYLLSEDQAWLSPWRFSKKYGIYMYLLIEDQA